MILDTYSAQNNKCFLNRKKKLVMKWPGTAATLFDVFAFWKFEEKNISQIRVTICIHNV